MEFKLTPISYCHCTQVCLASWDGYSLAYNASLISSYVPCPDCKEIVTMLSCH